jgi:hypothetical protein
MVVESSLEPTNNIDSTMMKIQPISALSCSLTAILVALSPLSVFAGTDDSIKPISPQVDRSIQGDDSIKPVAPNRKVLSPTSPTIQKSGNVDTGVKPLAPKNRLPAKKTTTGQNDDGI